MCRGDRCRRRAAAAAWGFGVLAAGCGGDGARAPVVPETGGTVRVAVLEPFDYLTPVRAVRAVTAEFLVHVTPPLGRVTEQGDIQWLLARTPNRLQPGLVFSLRPVYWEDGVRVTAPDFVRTVQVMLHPGAPGEERSRFGLVRDVVALDDTTLYFDLLELARARWRDALIAPLPAHVVGAGADPRALQEWPVTRRPLSCGPFRVAVSTTDSLVLQRRERSGWQVPPLDSVVVRWLSADAAVQEFRRGTVDVIDALPVEYVHAVRRLRRAQVYAFVGASYVYVGWNLRDARFGDLAVRRAAAMGVDVHRLSRHLTAGQGDPARGPLVPALGVPDTTPLLPYDVRSARALLESAAWLDRDGDGVREKRGSRLAFHLLVPEGDELRRRTATAVAAALRQIGMEVTVRVLVVEDFFGRLRQGSFEAYVGRWFPQTGQALADVWHSDASDRFNYGGFRNAAVDSILSRLRLEQPGPSEAEWLAALERQIYAEQPYLFLFQDPRFAVFSPRVRGARPTVLSTFWNLPEWWVAHPGRTGS